MAITKVRFFYRGHAARGHVRAGILSQRPAGSELDDAAFEPGALYENNALLAEVRRGRSDWSLLDVHSGLYMLGTRRKMGLS
jgi:hypothetical protein